MVSLTRLLGDRLKLTVSIVKSAVDRPWRRKFLGYRLTWYATPRLRIAGGSQQRLRARVHQALPGARGRSVGRANEELNPALRVWAVYFKLTETKTGLEDLHGCLRHKLGCMLRRQRKGAAARAKRLMKAGLRTDCAWRSACNGANHLNHAFPKSYFDRLGRVSLLDTARRLQGVL